MAKKIEYICGLCTWKGTEIVEQIACWRTDGTPIYCCWNCGSEVIKIGEKPRWSVEGCK